MAKNHPDPGDPFAGLVEDYLDPTRPNTIGGNTNGADLGPQGTLPNGWDANHVISLSLAVLLFGIIIFGIMSFLLYRDREPMAVLKICALPLIIISAVFLVIVGYSAEQIAPVLGLLGSIAGYLLGSEKAHRRLPPDASSPAMPGNPPPPAGSGLPPSPDTADAGS
ncbi:hypothetical protein [Haloferula sargassicola]|uniref:Uncharacterized protein n=1 Tax=Haloferula sargassicola TaxID=490096 RepID=A0ABP9UP47_9BACT